MVSDNERDRISRHFIDRHSNTQDLPTDLSFLVVEDEGIVAWDLEELLTLQAGGKVQLANSLAHARDYMATHQAIDFVITDWKLPDGSGLELMPSLGVSGIPFLMITGYPLDSQTENLPVLQKPFTSEKLLHAVRNEFFKLHRK